LSYAAKLRVFIGWLSLSAGVLALDQFSKRVVVQTLEHGGEIAVTPFFSWVRWHNPGAAFSMFADAGGWQRWVFVALAIGFGAFLVFELWRARRGELLQSLVYALILGGALGNMIDRATQGYVVDFIFVYYQNFRFPAFNVADSAIFVGAVLWCWLLFIEYRSTKASRA